MSLFVLACFMLRSFFYIIYIRNISKVDSRYIEKMVRYCSNKDLKLLVVTHHSPSYNIAAKRRDKFKYLYMSALDYLLQSNLVHTWVYGHVHCNIDIRTKHGTHLVTNQKGKPKDKITDFSLSKIITV